jgi:pyridoxal phosphate enzyme (YggS family)
MNPPVRGLLQDRLAAVEERLQAACARAGRPRSEVTLVAVTKTVSPRVAACLVELGVQNLGENRPQELWRKAAALPPEVHWHLVGHLQRNKIKRTLPLVHLVHSVDSLRLLEALDQEAGRQHRPIPVLLEVNASGEPGKNGFRPEEIPDLAPHFTRLANLKVSGLMTMAALEEEPQNCRPAFALLRQLRERLRSELGPAYPLEHLSMGMSNDFEVAVEEGATLVRLGTVLLEGLGEVEP